MYLPTNPLQRFQDVFAALNTDRGWFSDASPLRFAAITALSCPGEPIRIASSIRLIADQLKQRSGWFGELNGSLRFIVAAMLLQREDTAEDFMAEVERVRRMFRETRLPRGGIYEVIAVLILRGSENKSVSLADLERLKAIYEEMKRHHWWITGVGDFPACSILVGQQGSAEAIGEGIEAIYQELHSVGFKKGDPLQGAANLLYLANETPVVIASRYFELAEKFRTQRTRIWQSEYDELAILSFLKQPARKVVELVHRMQSTIRDLRPRPDRSLAFSLASSIAFMDLFKSDPNMNSIAGAKTMADMQAIINAQQAAAVAAMAAAAAASSASSASSG